MQVPEASDLRRVQGRSGEGRDGNSVLRPVIDTGVDQPRSQTSAVVRWNQIHRLTPVDIPGRRMKDIEKALIEDGRNSEQGCSTFARERLRPGVRRH